MELQQLLEAIKAAYANAGLLGALGAGLMLSLRVYQSPTITQLLPPRARWSSLPGWAKLALPGLLAAGGAVAVAISGGTALLPALVAALPVALSAILGHHATKALGQAMPDTLPARQALKLLLPLAQPVEHKDEAP